MAHAANKHRQVQQYPASKEGLNSEMMRRFGELARWRWAAALQLPQRKMLKTLKILRAGRPELPNNIFSVQCWNSWSVAELGHRCEWPKAICIFHARNINRATPTQLEGPIQSARLSCRECIAVAA